MRFQVIYVSVSYTTRFVLVVIIRYTDANLCVNDNHYNDHNNLSSRLGFLFDSICLNLYRSSDVKKQRWEQNKNGGKKTCRINYIVYEYHIVVFTLYMQRGTASVRGAESDAIITVFFLFIYFFFSIPESRSGKKRIKPRVTDRIPRVY